MIYGLITITGWSNLWETVLLEKYNSGNITHKIRQCQNKKSHQSNNTLVEIVCINITYLSLCTWRRLSRHRYKYGLRSSNTCWTEINILPWRNPHCKMLSTRKLSCTFSLNSNPCLLPVQLFYSCYSKLYFAFN